jgi:hypothetical protein
MHCARIFFLIFVSVFSNLVPAQEHRGGANGPPTPPLQGAGHYPAGGTLNRGTAQTNGMQAFTLR